MTYNNLPPQAYTKDDIARAFAWIQGQPERIRNMATSKETLVALYLQSRRNGNISLANAAPVSSREFHNQLKSLATELTQFDDPKKTPTDTPVPTPQKVAPKPEAIVPQMPTEAPQTILQQTPLPTDVVQKTFEEFKTRASNFENPLPTTAAKKTFSFQIDPRSEQIIRSVKAHLNMESEHDIIRMLLVLGFDRIKGLFPGNK